jgi:hypothetical protein
MAAWWVASLAGIGVAGGAPLASGPERARALAADLHLAAPTLDGGILQRALKAARCARARGLAGDSNLFTVIDYSKPSTEKRLWVFDLGTRRLLFHELVAHGKGTGENEALRFSNRPHSRQTCLGLFATGEAYEGEHGYSLRLDGLDPGVNCQARARAIVIHGAAYVSEVFAARHGRLGRSWGCPAVGAEIARPIIDAIRDGSLLYAYGNDPDWLAATEHDQSLCSTSP